MTRGIAADVGIVSTFRQWFGSPESGPVAARRLAERLVLADAPALPRILREITALPDGEIEDAIVAACAFLGDEAAKEVAGEKSRCSGMRVRTG